MRDDPKGETLCHFTAKLLTLYVGVHRIGGKAEAPDNGRSAPHRRYKEDPISMKTIRAMKKSGALAMAALMAAGAVMTGCAPAAPAGTPPETTGAVQQSNQTELAKVPCRRRP